MRKWPFVLLAGLLASCDPPPVPATMEVQEGTTADLEHHLQRLLSASNPGAVLIIAVAGADEDFIQFSASEVEVELDHPLITDRQISREQQVRNVLVQLGCTFRENTGSNGARFLDCYFSPNLEELNAAAEAVLSKVLGVHSDTPLVFTSHGLPLTSEE